MASGLANDGTILLQSSYNDDTDELNTGSGSFTNDADGTIQVNKGSERTGVIAGTLVNKGLINVDGGAFSYVSGTLSNQGTVAVDSTSYFYVNGAYDEDGGDVTAPASLIDNSAIYINVSPATPITIAMGHRRRPGNQRPAQRHPLGPAGTPMTPTPRRSTSPAALANDRRHSPPPVDYNDGARRAEHRQRLPSPTTPTAPIQVNRGQRHRGVIAGTLWSNKGAHQR